MFPCAIAPCRYGLLQTLPGFAFVSVGQISGVCAICVCPRALQQLSVLQGLAGAADDDLAGTFKDDLTLTVRDGSPLKLSPAQVKQMSREDLVKIWKVKTGLHCIPCKDFCSDRRQFEPTWAC